MDILKNHITEINALCERHKVKSLYAFGSVTGNTFNAGSDIDFLASFQPMDYGEYADNYFGLAAELEQLLGRPVDLITDNALSNPYFIESVNQSKQLVYG